MTSDIAVLALMGLVAMPAIVGLLVWAAMTITQFVEGAE